MTLLLDIFEYINPSPETITNGGLALITIIVFAETGLFFCFWLPGDYLLFTAGLLVGVGQIQVPIWVMLAALFGAAVSGNYAGFLIGRYAGQSLENRPDTFFFKKRYIQNTRDVFEKYGGLALIIGRFLPIVRSFAPLLAGIVRMGYRQFFFFNVVGALLWIGVLAGLGYWLGDMWGDAILKYLHYIIMGFIAFTSITVINTYLKLNKERKQKQLLNKLGD
jgi:membrane-associated protein